MERFLLVGLGGALGAVGRYSVGLLPVRAAFPVLTLSANLAGALLIGFLAGLNVSGRWSLFWKTGVCGGFTTFSTFSLEAFQLLERGEFLRGGIYILLSVALCLAGVLLGRCVGKAFAGT